MSSDKKLVCVFKNLILHTFRAIDNIIQVCTLQVEHIKHRIHSYISTINTNRRTNFQIYSGTKLYIFRAVSLPILRSLSTVHSTLAHVIQVLTTACLQDQELSTVHSALAHVIQFWRQPVYRIRMERSSILILHAGCRQNCITCASAECTVDNSWSCRQAVVKTCITCASVECTVDNSWGWAEKLPKKCRVSYQNKFGNQCVCWCLL